MKWYQTHTPTSSEHVRKLMYEGRGWEIMKAIKNEQKRGTGVGTFNGITVKRVDRKV